MNEKDPQQTPVEQVGPIDPLPDIRLEALRTYKNDISRTVSQDKITTAKILLAEQKQNEKKETFVPETSVKKPKNIITLFLGTVFLLGAIGVLGFFAYTRLVPQTPEISFNTTSFFLFAFDNEKFVDVAKSKNEVHIAVDKVVTDADQMKENTYTDIVFYRENATTEQADRISSTEFFKLYEVVLPTGIGRSISKDFVYGLYKTDTNVEPFVVIGLVDFENAFDSMFVWESTLAIDMREFFPNLMKIFADNPEVPQEVPVVVATSTATSTLATSTKGGVFVSVATTTNPVLIASSTVPYNPINRNVRFTDVVLSNRDTRALRDDNGTPYFYYTFIDRDKILFAQDPRLITEIVRKVREKQLVR